MNRMTAVMVLGVSAATACSSFGAKEVVLDCQLQDFVVYTEVFRITGRTAVAFRHEPRQVGTAEQTEDTYVLRFAPSVDQGIGMRGLVYRINRYTGEGTRELVATDKMEAKFIQITCARHTTEPL